MTKPEIEALCDEAAITTDRAAVIALYESKQASDDPPAATVEGIVELALAVACERGDEAAITRFDREYLNVVPQAVAHMKLPAATVEDIRSMVRDKLLAKLSDYAGRGRLRGLVQVTATRCALDRIRIESREVELPARDKQAAPVDVALSLIKAQYRAAFSAGFAAAVANASRRDRNLLRLHFLGGMTLEQLATMYNVHRATIVRWLAAAREAVFSATRKHVESELKAPADELDEMFSLVQSRIELSMERLLATHEGVTAK